MTRWLDERPRSLLVAAAILGLAARLAFGLLYWVDKPLTHDEREYLELAGNLAAGRGLRYDPLPPQPPDEVPFQRFDRAPGYPAFLAAVASFGAADAQPRSTPAGIKVVQAVAGAVGVAVIGILAARIGGPAAGAIAAFGAALYPPLVWICAYALSEALYSVLALACALVLFGAAASPRPGRRSLVVALVLGGALAGIAALVRPVMVLFVGLYAAWLVFRRVPAHAAAFALGAAIVIAPWTLRASERAHRFVLIATEGGVTFWTGNHPLASGEGDLAANPQLKSADIQLRSRHRNLDADALEPIYYREAFDHIRADPARWVAVMIRKLIYQWIPIGPSYRLHSTLYAATSIASYAVVLPLGLAGLIRLVHARRVPALLMLLAASQVLAGLIFLPQERYRIPVIDPVLLIFAAVWLASRRALAGPFSYRRPEDQRKP
jgi:hypothetical protein